MNNNEEQYIASLACQQRGDHGEAIKLLTPLSTINFKNSKMLLGYSYLVGSENIRNKETAKVLFLESFQFNQDNNSAFYLGRRFFESGDLTESIKYFHFAATNGLWSAYYNLAVAIEGAKLDSAELAAIGVDNGATHYLKLAAERGHIVAMKRLYFLSRYRSVLSYFAYIMMNKIFLPLKFIAIYTRNPSDHRVGLW